MKICTTTLLSLTALAAVWLAPVTARAQSYVPYEMLYEGYLEISGVPATGTASITVSLYNSDSAVTADWSESFSAALNEGWFTVVLGGGSELLLPADIAAASHIEIDVDGTNLGRRPLAAVPYALRAGAVRWSDIEGIPSGFADDTDDVSSGGGGGTVTQIDVGSGLTAVPTTITVNGTISVNFGGDGSSSTVARSDHSHGAYALSDANVSFADLSADTVTATDLVLTNPPSISNKPVRTMAWWVGPNALLSYDGGSTSPCFVSIVGRGGCDADGNGTSFPAVDIFLDGVPDGATIVGWGLHVGTSSNTEPDSWECGLKHDSSNVGFISFDEDDGVGSWDRYESQSGLSYLVDISQGLESGSNNQGFKVKCAPAVGESTPGRVQFLQVWIKYTAP